MQYITSSIAHVFPEAAPFKKHLFCLRLTENFHFGFVFVCSVHLIVEICLPCMLTLHSSHYLQG